MERLLAVLMRPRTPPAPAVTAAAFQALMRLHELHPPSTVEELPSTAALPVRLVENPRAWAPVDAFRDVFLPPHRETVPIAVGAVILIIILAILEVLSLVSANIPVSPAISVHFYTACVLA